MNMCVCVRLHIQPSLHTYSLPGESVSARVLSVFQCVSVSLCFVKLSKPVCSNVLFYATDFCVSIYAFLTFVQLTEKGF